MKVSDIIEPTPADVPKGYKLTGEFRQPKEGEYYMGITNTYTRAKFTGPVICDGQFSVINIWDRKRHILAEEGKSDKIMLKCINNTDCTDVLTIGKKYEVLKESENYYSIKNDKGYTPISPSGGGYWKHRFEKVTTPISSVPSIAPVARVIFDGPGKYELVNGQVVDLDERRVCLESNKIVDSNGNTFTFTWAWEQDGTIVGFFPNRPSLFLSKKLESAPKASDSSNPSEYVILDMDKYGHLLGRMKIDEYQVKNWHENKWELICTPQYRSMKSYADSVSECKWRCKRKDLPTLVPTEKAKENTKAKGSYEDPEEIVKITDIDHVGRKGDYISIHGDNKWTPISSTIGEILSKPFSFGCKRKDLPLANPANSTNPTPTPTVAALKPPNTYNTYSPYTYMDKSVKWSIGSKEVFANLASFNDAVSFKPEKEKEEEKMKKETAIAVSKFAGTWAFRTLNYWGIEPALGIFRPIIKSVRYATFLGGLCAGCYGYYHPEVVVNGIKSCIPKISIEAPSILQGDAEVTVEKV